MSAESLGIAALKTRLRQTFAKAMENFRKEAAPLLAELRKRMNAQGQKGKGFGAWVERNLPITRRTADLWADEYERNIGKRTSRKVSKGRPEEGPIQLQFILVGRERKEFREAWKALDVDERQRVVVEAVIDAAREKKVEVRKAAAGK